MVFKKQKSLQSIIEDEEHLARYIFSNSHLRADGSIRHQAFMPPVSKCVLSVIRHKDCSKACLLKIGQGMEQRRAQSLKAIGFVLAKGVRSIDGLDVEPDTAKGQHRRHANITGFPCFDKAKIRQKAKDLANQAQLLLKVF